MATAAVTLQLHQSQFLAGLARAQGAVRGLSSSVGQVGKVGFLVAGAAAITFATATAVGIKRAFDFGGKLADMSAISGRSVTNILLMRRALEDAGVSMEKVDHFLLTGQDRGGLIQAALKTISAGDWADAAKSIGKQAEILDKNAKTFDRISDLLGRAGQKLEGFFVGAASKVATSLLPFLEKFDKMDFASQGEKFGSGLLQGMQALVGFFQKPEVLLGPFQDAFTAIILGIGNVLLAVFKKALSVLQAGAQAFFEKVLEPVKDGVDFWTGGEAKSKSIADRTLEIANQTPLEVADVFHAKDAVSNARSGVEKAAALGKSVLPTPTAAPEKGLSREEQAAAGEKKFQESQQAAAKAISQISFSQGGQSGSIDESMFSKNASASEDDFASRWGQPKPSEAKDAKTDKIFERIAVAAEKQQETTDKAWGKN